MAEHDDDLDRRITDLLGLAQHDAPVPAETALPRRHRTGRWMAAAAAVALVGVGVAALALRDDPETVAPVESVPETTVATSDSSTVTQSSVSPSTVVDEPSDCSAPAVDNYDMFGSMHTLVESTQPLDVKIEAFDAPWCPGGTGNVRVTITNRGVGQEQPDPIVLILNGGFSKYQLVLDPEAQASPPVLGRGESMSMTARVTLPAVPPGSYSLQLYGFGPGTEVNVSGPPACNTVDLAAVAGAGARASGQEITSVTVTNRGDTACFLGRPLSVMATAPDGTMTASPIPFEEGGFFILDDPRPSRVLEPGKSTMVVLTTPTNCPGSTTPTYWSQMQLWTGPQGNSNVVVDLGPDNRVHTDCGLALSGWAAPRPPG